MKLFNLFESPIVSVELDEGFNSHEIETHIDLVIDHIAKTYGDGFDWETESETDFVDEYWDELTARIGEEPSYDDLSTTFEDHPDLKQKYLHWVKSYWLDDKVRQYISVITSTTKQVGGAVVLYRVITANADWYPNRIHTQPLGVYWSHDTNAADAHWGGNHTDMWKIRCHAPISSIDWFTTLVNNVMNPHEAEIHLSAGSTVLVDQILLMSNNRWLEPNVVDPAYPPMKPQRMRT